MHNPAILVEFMIEEIVDHGFANDEEFMRVNITHNKENYEKWLQDRGPATFIAIFKRCQRQQLARGKVMREKMIQKLKQFWVYDTNFDHSNYPKDSVGADYIAGYVRYLSELSDNKLLSTYTKMSHRFRL